MSTRVVCALALGLLLLPALVPPAGADAPAARARYVLGMGLPAPWHFGLVCWDLPDLVVGGGTLVTGPLGVEQPLPLVKTEGVWVAGACFTVAPGNRTVTVTGDLGDAPGYWWALWHDGEDAHLCEDGRASGTLLLVVPEGCDRIEVIPLWGSPAGVIEVA